MDVELQRNAKRRACIGAARLPDGTLVSVIVTDIAWDEAGQQGAAPCDHPAVLQAAWLAAIEDPFHGQLVDGHRLANSDHLDQAFADQ
jgi:hypothetical protein